MIKTYMVEINEGNGWKIIAENLSAKQARKEAAHQTIFYDLVRISRKENTVQRGPLFGAVAVYGLMFSLLTVCEILSNLLINGGF